MCTAAPLHAADVTSEKQWPPPLGTTRFPEPKPQATDQSRLKRKASAAELFSPVFRDTLTAHASGCPKAVCPFSQGLFCSDAPPVSDPLAWTVRSVLVSFSQNEQLLVGAEPAETYKREGDRHVL